MVVTIDFKENLYCIDFWKDETKNEKIKTFFFRKYSDAMEHLQYQMNWISPNKIINLIKD